MKKIIFILLIMLVPMLAHSQVTKFKSVFVMNFIRYVGWPEETKKGDFIIGVLKDKELARYMREQSDGKKFGFQDVVIMEFNAPEEVTKCQVIFVSSSVNFSKYASVIIEKTGNKNTLIVTESEGATNSGSMINFVVRDDKLRFEIHKANAAKSGVPISSKLEAMANAISL